jgi:hypothetical protein
MTEPNNIGLLGSGRRIVLDDGAVTEIVSAPRGAEAVNEWHRHRDPLTGDRGFESCSLQRRVTCEPDFGAHPLGASSRLPHVTPDPSSGRSAATARSIRRGRQPEDRRGTVSVFNGQAPEIETFDDRNKRPKRLLPPQDFSRRTLELGPVRR